MTSPRRLPRDGTRASVLIGDETESGIGRVRASRGSTAKLAQSITSKTRIVAGILRMRGFATPKFKTLPKEKNWNTLARKERTFQNDFVDFTRLYGYFTPKNRKNHGT
jgi:hypothetical protein